MSKVRKKYPAPDRSNFVPNQFINNPEIPEEDLGYHIGILDDKRPFRSESWYSEGYQFITYFFSSNDIEEASNEELLSLLKNQLIKDRVPVEYWKKIDIMKIIDASNNSMYSITFIFWERSDQLFD